MSTSPRPSRMRAIRHARPWASCRPALSPWPPAGLFRWAASPARITRPARKRCEREPAAAVRETILTALRVQHRERLRRLIGDHPDLDLRADLGPAYILFHGAFLGRAVTDDELGALLPLITGECRR